MLAAFAAASPAAAQTYDAWRMRVFSPGEQTDPAVSGESAPTPNGSGLTNLLCYAFDLDPHQPVPAGALPTLSLVPGWAPATGLPATSPALTWQSSSAFPAADLSYVPELTTDLARGPWQRGKSVFGTPRVQYPARANALLLNTATSLLPAGGNPGGVLLRLRVLRGHALPEDWQRANFNQTDMDPEADADGDGRTNWQEFLVGTDPNDFYDGNPPSLALLGGGDQRGDPGTVLPVPVSGRFRATVAATGRARTTRRSSSP